MASESPKWIALVLSIVAIAISGLSWWESHRNRAINAAANRPIFTIDAIVPDYQMPKNDHHNIYVDVPLKIKNIGKATATIDRVEFYVSGSMPHCEVTNYEARIPIAGTAIPQGLEEKLPGGFSMSSECPKQWTAIFFDLSIYYTDDGSGNQYNQDFSQFLDMKYKDKIPYPIILRP